MIKMVLVSFHELKIKVFNILHIAFPYFDKIKLFNI